MTRTIWLNPERVNKTLAFPSSQTLAAAHRRLGRTFLTNLGRSGISRESSRSIRRYTGMGSDSENEKSVKERKKLMAVAPIAKPLAGKKLCKRSLKLVRRGSLLYYYKRCCLFLRLIANVSLYHFGYYDSWTLGGLFRLLVLG